jgi:hypothetical protein
MATPENVASKVFVRESEIGKMPFSAKRVPVELQVTAAKLSDWRAEDGAADPVPG